MKKVSAKYSIFSVNTMGAEKKGIFGRSSIFAFLSSASFAIDGAISSLMFFVSPSDISSKLLIIIP